MNKDTIFISHCTPDDNYFTTFLATKLKQLGYKVWVELDELRLGDAFWPEIEKAIRTKAAKVLIVVSKKYLERVNNPSSGIFKELSCADAIRDISNFKCPLRLDDVNFNDFPATLMGLHAIDFQTNWQTGLESLIDALNTENFPFDKQQQEDPINFWLHSFHVKEILNKDQERIYTNWFPIRLPQKIFVNHPTVKAKIDLADIVYPYIEESDRHVCFFGPDSYPDSISCSSSVEMNISDVLENRPVPVDSFFILNEPRKKLVRLLNKAFADFLFQSKLLKYQQSNIEVFYWPYSDENKKRISLKAVQRTSVAVAGKTADNRWCFGISASAILLPTPFFRINSHIIFQNRELELLDQDQQHALRRKYAFDWYNKDWMDTLLGMMLRISNSNPDQKILIPIGRSEILEVNGIPMAFTADFGYTEPKTTEKDEQ